MTDLKTMKKITKGLTTEVLEKWLSEALLEQALQDPNSGDVVSKVELRTSIEIMSEEMRKRNK